MTLKNQLRFCKVCENKKFDPNNGVLCGLTDSKPDFQEYCTSFDGDVEKIKKIQEPEVAEEVLSNEDVIKMLPHEAKDMLRKYQSFGFAVFGGTLVAILAAIVWAAITVATKYQIGWVAIGIGLAVGFSIQFFGAGIDRKFGVLGAILATISCMLGNVLSIVGLGAIEENITYLEMLSVLTPLLSVLLVIEAFEPIDLLFYGLAAFEGYKFAFRKVPQDINYSAAFVPALQTLRQPLALTSAVAIGFIMIFVSLNTTQNKINYYESGAISSKGTMIHGLPEGTWEYYYDESGLMTVGDYLNGEEEGLWTYYNEDNKVSATKYFHKGLAHGESISNYDNGAIFQKGQFEYGRMQGVWITYYENEEVSSYGIYDTDKEDGEWNYFHENGQISASGMYADGFRKGLWKMYDENGLLTEEVIYGEEENEVEWMTFRSADKTLSIKDGNGKMKTFHPNGQLATVGNVVNKKRDGIWSHFDERGKKLYTQKYTLGKGQIYEIFNNNNYPLIQNGNGVYVSYFESGLVEREGKYINGLKEGNWLLYFDDDGKTISETENYKKGLLEGRFISYFEDGLIYLEGEFAAGKRNGMWKWYNYDGSLDTEVYYIDGKKDGDQTFYDIYGDIYKIESYKNGKLVETKLL